MLEYLIELDKEIFLMLNGFFSNPLLDLIMIYVSKTLPWIPFYLIILLMIYKKLEFRTLTTLFFIALVVFLADRLSVVAFKDVFERLRPCHNIDFEGIIHLPKGKSGGHFGFVSSHASNVFGIATFSALISRHKNFVYVVFGWAALVSYSRIYLGVHYPGDIIGGAVLGASIGAFVYWLHQKYNEKLYLFVVSKFRRS